MPTKHPKSHTQQRTATQLSCPTAKESMLGPRGKTTWLTHNSTLLTLLKDTHIQRVARRIRRRLLLFRNLRHHLATTLPEMEDSGLTDGLISHGLEVTQSGVSKVITGLTLRAIWTRNPITKITLNLKRCSILVEALALAVSLPVVKKVIEHRSVSSSSWALRKPLSTIEWRPILRSSHTLSEIMLGLINRKETLIGNITDKVHQLVTKMPLNLQYLIQLNNTR